MGQDIALRIKELIENQGLSNKEFAKRLSINPSIISHILSGRNKVSLQVVEQIVKEFTNVSLDYLLLGTGSLFKGVTNVNYNSNLQPEEERINPASLDQDQPKSPEKYKQKSKVELNSNKEIDQVIIFYADGSFKIYKQNS
mgnify:CR=1 FL=1|tara:strand:+ start:218 stop:640 length:423 start_codon:yes stop_codon:yes gene_type:complete